MARSLVNISCILPGEWLLDPFCGTGGIILESEMIGVNAVGNDVTASWSPEPVKMFRVQTSSGQIRPSSLTGTILLMQRSRICHTGSPVIIIADNLEHLYTDALKEIRRVLKPGKKAVIVTHRDIRTIAEGIMEVEAFYEQRVHKSLTRRILVLKK